MRVAFFLSGYYICMYSMTLAGITIDSASVKCFRLTCRDVLSVGLSK